MRSEVDWFHEATGALSDVPVCAEVAAVALEELVAPAALFSAISDSALMSLQVVSPRALAKWSSTESFFDLMAFHLESPKDLAKCSSTDPAYWKQK